MALPLLGTLIGGAISALSQLGKSWLETRKVKAEGKIAIATAEIQAKVVKIEKEASMDTISAEDMRYSYKDELWSIVFAAILIASFLPWTQPYVKTGFQFLKTETPEWFEWAFLGIIAASFGLRTWVGWKK